MLNFGLQIILVLIITAGFIAYLGDLIGRKIGRKRITLFSLRPRYTAIFFTVLSGIIIAVFTLATLVIISKDAQTALFGLEGLKQEINSVRDELAKKSANLNEIQDNLGKARQEIVELEALKRKLGVEIERAREGALIYKAGETILVTKLVAGQTKKQTEQVLEEIVDAVNSYLKKISLKDSSKKHITVAKYEATLNFLLKNDGEYVLTAVVDENVIIGEIVPIHFELQPNKLVYKKNEILVSANVDGKKSRQDVEQELKKVLSLSHVKARELGVVPDVNGSVGRIPYSIMFRAAEQINKLGRQVYLEVQAARDIYAIGPLDVQFQIK